MTPKEEIDKIRKQERQRVIDEIEKWVDKETEREDIDLGGGDVIAEFRLLAKLKQLKYE